MITDESTGLYSGTKTRRNENKKPRLSLQTNKRRKQTTEDNGARKEITANPLTSDNIRNSHPGDNDKPQASCGYGGACERAEKPVT